LGFEVRGFGVKKEITYNSSDVIGLSSATFITLDIMDNLVLAA
jgi:hypothetical protein